jgi:hypothetical protein
VAAKSDQLSAKTDQLAAKSDEITELNRKIADLSERYAAYAMGTGSYFYLHVREFGGPSPRAEVKHIGSNPVRDTEILIFDITDQISDLAARRTTKYDIERIPKRKYFVSASYAGRVNRLTDQSFETSPSRDSYAYFVNMQGANGTYRQVIQFRRVGNEWKQAYIVQQVLADDTFKPIGQFFDEGFPTDGDVIIRTKADYPLLP